MGYATHPGFRAGTCTPFLWFDLEENKCTQLKIFPITFMDGSIAQAANQNITEAQILIQQLTNAVKEVNGTYISIWHNHTVSDNFGWKGWRAVFENSLNYIIEP